MSKEAFLLGVLIILLVILGYMIFKIVQDHQPKKMPPRRLYNRQGKYLRSSSSGSADGGGTMAAADCGSSGDGGCGGGDAGGD